MPSKPSGKSRDINLPQDGPEASRAAPGRSCFLGISINEYQHFSKLRNAVRDMEAIRDLLIREYDLGTEDCRVLCDAEATRRGILRSLNELDQWVGKDDKLIIYYSGHGHLNRNERGFWVPVDAAPGAEEDYVSNAQLRELIADIPARHILLISDACFSGTLFVRAASRADTADDDLETLPSRWALCSGRHNQLVADGPPDGHSPFADSILAELKRNQRQALRVASLADRVIELTRANYDQLPEGNPLQGVGHKGGQYVFRRQLDEGRLWAACQAAGTAEQMQHYLSLFPTGKHAGSAQQFLADLAAEQEWARLQSLLSDDLAQIAAKKQGIREFCRQYPRSPHFAAAIKLGEDLDYKQEFLRKYDSEFGLMGFIQKDTPYREAARKRLAELEKANAQASPVSSPAPKPKPPPQPAVPHSKPAAGETPVSRPAATAPKQYSPPPKRTESKWLAYTAIGAALLLSIFLLFRYCGKEPPVTETPSVAADMVRIPGGTFDMGCTAEQKDCQDREKPVTRVTVSDFYLGKYEVTVEAFAAFVAATGYRTDAEKGDGSYVYDGSGWNMKAGVNWRHDGEGKERPRSAWNYPVVHVSWNDAIAYCNWRSEKESLSKAYTISGDKVTANWNANGYRLPTEAEWEYAARGGGKAVLFGNGKNVADPKEINFDASADYKEPYSVAGEYRQKTVPVGSLNSPNALGLHDMSGNVWEWCWDWHETFPGGERTNYRGPDTGSNRVLRGGSWVNVPQHVRVAVRGGSTPGDRNFVIGFRLARPH